MRTEEEILQDFKKLGYAIDNNKNHCYMNHKHNNKTIIIEKSLKKVACCKLVSKPYETIINGTKMETKHFNSAEPISLSIIEFKLIHELFECWGWL